MKRMGGNRTSRWVEGYLYGARGHRALEQSVFAAGERAGFSERKLRRAGQTLGVSLTASCWELPHSHAAALDAQCMLTLEPASHALAPLSLFAGAPQRVRRAA
jgi:hypothetical protein